MPKQSIKNKALISSKAIFSNLPKTAVKDLSKEVYYSIFVLSEEIQTAHSSIVSDLSSNVLKISLCNMAIYECYLFAFGLPINFPTEQIIICGGNQKKQMRCKVTPDDLIGDKCVRYYYELTMPVHTTQEEYLKRILNDFNTYFQLDAKVEKLLILKDSRKISRLGEYSLDLIWNDQLMMVLNIKDGLFHKKFSGRRKR